MSGVYCENGPNHKHAIYENAELLNVIACATYSYDWPLKE